MWMTDERPEKAIKIQKLPFCKHTLSTLTIEGASTHARGLHKSGHAAERAKAEPDIVQVFADYVRKPADPSIEAARLPAIGSFS